MAEETTPTPAPAETASATPAAAGPPAGIDATVWELGKKQYETPGSCTTCHQPTGAGITGAFPPLEGSEWVLGPVENLIKIQLRGLQGPIEVKGQTYTSVMTPLSTQTDEQIAAVLTFVRNSWGNKASAVTPDMVKALRDEVGKPMLTAAELLPPIPETAVDAVAMLAPAVTADMPKTKICNTFPHGLFAIVFLLVVGLASAKFLLGKSQ